MSGDSTTNNPGNFGIQGMQSPLNEPPSLYESCEWTDLNGNFWLFGGLHFGPIYNDLWKYDLVTNEWTWMKGSGVPNNLGTYGTQGVPSPTNNPPSLSYGINSWVDLSGNLWLFGGGGNNGVYSDLWKYDIQTNEWTWMKGPGVAYDSGSYGNRWIPDPSNNPPARSETAISWTDNAGDFWLFGGSGFTFFTPPSYNDLWKFNIGSNNWTWVNGDSLTNHPSVYGTQGIEDTANTPGARWAYTRWKDNNGYLWMYGGAERWNTGHEMRNDLWRFNPLTSCWAWMDGDTIGDITTQNGTQCAGDQENLPDNTFECRPAWIDPGGNFWTYIPGNGILNSLWMYCKPASSWAIIKSDSSQTTGAPVWGTKGVSDPSVIPPYLQGAISWTDNNGHLYMFGGWWYAGLWSNALWMYTIDPCCSACNAGAPSIAFNATDTTICPGSCISMINNSQFYSGYQWQFPGGNPFSSNAFNPQNICYSSPGSYNITLVADGCGAADTLVFANYIYVYPFPLPQGIIQNGDTLFANAGAASYQWFFNTNIIIGATNYFYVATQSGNYNIVATDSNGCEVEAVINNVIATTPPNLPQGEELTAYPNPVTTTLDVRGLKNNSAHEIKIFNVFGEKVFSAADWKPGTVNCQLLPSGIYYLEIISDKKIHRMKFLKQ